MFETPKQKKNMIILTKGHVKNTSIQRVKKSTSNGQS